MSKEVYISINKWEKYNPRKDLKTLSWLRLDSDIGFSESLFGLSAEAKWLWIFLLSYSAKKNNAEFLMDLEYISYHSSIKKENILKHVESFVGKGLIELNQVVLEHERIRSNPIESVSYERTNERTNVTNITYTTDLAIELQADEISSCEKTSKEEMCEDIAALWNEMALLNSLPKVKTPLSKDRQKKMQPAIGEFKEYNDWLKIINAVVDNEFNLGINDRKWKANFDWLFHTTKFNYRKLWESSSEEYN